MIRLSHLLLALMLLPSCALAVPLNDGVTLWFPDGETMWVRCPDGRIHTYSPRSDTWTFDRVPPLPIPREQVNEWMGAFFIQSNGSLWAYDAAAGVGWHEITYEAEATCGAPVTNESESLGTLKSMFR